MGSWDALDMGDAGVLEKIGTVVWIILLLFLAALAIFAAFQWLTTEQPHDELIGTETEIISLHDGGTVVGSFFLGCGQIHGEMQYTAYAVTSGGGYKLIQLPVDATTIYEDEEYSPHITEYRLMEVSSDGEVLRKSNDNWWEYPYYEIHVPEGTIIQQYSLDAV